jgi:phosphatidylinositol alpha-1,6-mannosyltransferase
VSPAEAPLIVCAARLEAEKQVSVLIEAMPEVIAALPGAVCVIAGEGKQRAELQALIEA